MRIAVLLATHNGERFLDEQLRSIADQTVEAKIDIIASDDGSTDGTRACLETWQAGWSRGAFTVDAGPGQGFAENFRSLIGRAGTDADSVAFSDQDDVWMPDKLAVAVATLGESRGPALYCSRTRIVDEDLKPIGLSPLFARPPHFRNALVQSLAGGNTMVLNRAAFALVAESARRTSFVSHDWWCYLVVSGAGGHVVYDPQPHIDYRQHGGNAVGHNTGVRARLIRLRRSLGGQFRRWNEANIAGLETCRDLLTVESRETLDQFSSLRAAGAMHAIYFLRRAGLYRQLAGGNISLALAAILRKL